MFFRFFLFLFIGMYMYVAVVAAVDRDTLDADALCTKDIAMSIRRPS